MLRYYSAEDRDGSLTVIDHLENTSSSHLNKVHNRATEAILNPFPGWWLACALCTLLTMDVQVPRGAWY